MAMAATARRQLVPVFAPARRRSSSIDHAASNATRATSAQRSSVGITWFTPFLIVKSVPTTLAHVKLKQLGAAPLTSGVSV